MRSNKLNFMVGAVLLVSVLFVQPVEADNFQPLITSTPNRTPPPIPTSGGVYFQPDADFGDTYCPIGGVQGIGQVTPDPLWLVMCGACMPTVTPYPTYSFPTGTIIVPTLTQYYETPMTATAGPSPTPTITYTPAPTVTPDANNYLACGDTADGWDCNQVDAYTLRYDSPVIESSVSLNLFDFTSGSHTGQTMYVSVVVPSYDILFSYDHLRFSVGYLLLMNTGRSSYFEIDDYEIINEDVRRVANAGQYDGTITYDTGWQFHNNEAVGVLRTMEGVVVFISSYPINDIATPTPTSSVGYTPVGGYSYCASVNNGIGDMSNQQIIFWGAVSEPECVQIPSYSTEDVLSVFTGVWFLLLPEGVQDFILGIANFMSVTTPAVTFCLQPYDFYDINLLGIRLSWSVFIDGIIVLWIINHFYNK